MIAKPWPSYRQTSGSARSTREQCIFEARNTFLPSPYNTDLRPRSILNPKKYTPRST